MSLIRGSTAAALAAFGMTIATFAETITVCASGCDYTSINAAIAAASDGDVIQLAAETYFEGEVVDTQGKSIVLRGSVGPDGNPESEISGGGQHRVLVCRSGESAGTRIESLVIRDGLRRSSGGGGAAVVECSPWFVDCVFVGNVTTNDSFLTGGGGGVLVYYGNPRFEDCIFEENTAPLGGGLRTIGSSVLVNNGVVARNAALDSGGGIDAYTSGITLSSVLMEDNTASIRGGGMHAISTNVAINFSTFRDNQAGSGGGVSLQGFDVQSVLSSTFSGNVATSNNGGAAYVQYGNQPDGALWTGCTFFGNRANDSGGAIAVSGFGTGGQGDPGWRCVLAQFIQNEAGVQGGAIDFSGNFLNRQPSVVGTDFSGNSAPVGASISLGSSLAELTDCEFDECCQVSPLTGFEDGGSNDLGWPCVDCIGDVTCDSNVTSSDLGRLISAWGTASPRYDLDEDGNVDSADLGLLIAAWGPCN